MVQEEVVVGPGQESYQKAVVAAVGAAGSGLWSVACIRNGASQGAVQQQIQDQQDWLLTASAESLFTTPGHASTAR